MIVQFIVPLGFIKNISSVFCLRPKKSVCLFVVLEVLDDSFLLLLKDFSNYLNSLRTC